MTSIDNRIKRAKFRANHRGTKEMDLALGRYAEAEADEMSEEQLAALEELLLLPDPEIEAWIKGGVAPPGLAGLILEIRRFHRLEG